MIYFDNAATTYLKPRQVYTALNRSVKLLSSNPGRSSHRAALLASEALYNAREAVADLFGCESQRVVFTYNATYALNLAIKTTIKEKCHVIISDLEHNSVIRVLNSLKNSLGIEFSRFQSDRLSEESLKKILRNDTKAIISTLASNVTGKEIDELLLSNFAKKYGLKLILDASQAAGHRKIDLKKTPCDVLCAPGHKALFGIMGSGLAVFSGDERGASFIEGGSGSDSISYEMPRSLPDGYEAGTVALPAIITLGEGCRFIKKTGEDNIKCKLTEYTKIITERLSEYKDMKIFSEGSGIVSFSLKGISSSELASLLDKYGIAVRAGLHCAPEAHKKLGTIEEGLVRSSLSFFNTKKEVDKFCTIINKIVKKDFRG